MQKLLTIVVPVYKVEPYINKCLDSCVLEDEKLMSQLEVIIVNDGTPDNSAEMSREYVKRYPQTFRQIDKANGGHGSAWNVGLKEATGKYLRFLDSDDWLTNLDKLMAKLAMTDADIVLSDFTKCYISENRDELRIAPNATENPIMIDKAFVDKCRYNYELLNFWHSTYKTKILQPLLPLFAEHVMYDDSALFIAPIIYGSTYESINVPIYNYLLGREGQTMQASVQRKNIDSYWSCIKQLEKLRMESSKYVQQEHIQYMDNVIQDYVHNFMGMFILLPYKESHITMSYLLNKYPYEPSKMPKYVIRFHKMPFFVFFFLERIRTIKNNISYRLFGHKSK